MFRKFVVLGLVVLILMLAGLPAITDALDQMGIIPAARAIQAEYLTGTVIAIIVTLLVLLPSVGCVWRRWPVTHCPVCDQQLRQRGRYCPACGSRVAA
jgi:uncharacterized membrane protein YhaH (DUF805 family)